MLKTKVCSVCKTALHVLEFGIDRSVRDGLNHRCKTCNRKSSKLWKSANPQKANAAYWRRAEYWRARRREQYRLDPSKRRSYDLRKDYGITLETFNKLVEEQNWSCAICLTKLTRPCVDHDHRTGTIRGILCRSCNLLLGLLRDSAETAEAISRYLRKSATA